MGEGREVSIVLNPASESETDTLSATAFGVSLAAWVAENEDIDSLPNGKYRPSFVAFVEALESQIEILRELRDGGTTVSRYINDLILVADTGYLREYVWVFHAVPSWYEHPAQDLKLGEYSKWHKIHLKQHTPRNEAQLRIESG